MRGRAGLRVTARAKKPAALVLDSDRGSEQAALVQESNHKSVGAALTRLTTLAATARVVVVRALASCHRPGARRCASGARCSTRDAPTGSISIPRTARAFWPSRRCSRRRARAR
jgi:hypothetical protein